MKTKIIQIIDGPNLNLTGNREKQIYGEMAFITYLDTIKDEFPEFDIRYYQSNIEGELIDMIQLCGKSEETAIIINPGGYSHTSVAIADAIKAVNNVVVEVHISNVHSREDYRKQMITGSVCKGIIMGLGLESYKMALLYFQQNKD